MWNELGYFFGNSGFLWNVGDPSETEILEEMNQTPLLETSWLLCERKRHVTKTAQSVKRK